MSICDFALVKSRYLTFGLGCDLGVGLELEGWTPADEKDTVTARGQPSSP
jgi:hypothetical protein